MKLIYIVAFYCTLIMSCENNRQIQIDENTIAEGRIDGDSIYDGLIKFYDKNSARLIRQYSYNNGVLEGEGLEYNLTGTVAAKSNFINGKKHGNAYHYDEKGQLIREEYFYHDLRVGPSIDFSEGKRFKFSFNSLEGENLISFYYDSLVSKSITAFNKNYFFLRTKYFSNSASHSYDSLEKEYFLYLPNPPKHAFEYSLVEIDTAYNVLKEIKTFDAKLPWATFTIQKAQKPIYTSLRLIINDSINGKITMFKRLSPT